MGRGHVTDGRVAGTRVAGASVHRRAGKTDVDGGSVVGCHGEIGGRVTRRRRVTSRCRCTTQIRVASDRVAGGCAVTRSRVALRGVRGSRARDGSGCGGSVATGRSVVHQVCVLLLLLVTLGQVRLDGGWLRLNVHHS